MGNSETEYDDIMRCSGKIKFQLLSAIITFNLGTFYYHKGKELGNVLLMPNYTSVFTNTVRLNPQTMHNVCFY